MKKTLCTFGLIALFAITAAGQYSISDKLRTNVAGPNRLILIEDTNAPAGSRWNAISVSSLHSNMTLYGSTFADGALDVSGLFSGAEGYFANYLRAAAFRSADDTEGASGTVGAWEFKNGLATAIGSLSGGSATNAIGTAYSNGTARVTSATGLDFRNGTDIVTIVESNATTTARVTPTVTGTTGSGGIARSNAPSLFRPVLVQPTLAGIASGSLLMVNGATNATNVTLGPGLSLAGTTLSVSGGSVGTTNTVFWTEETAGPVSGFILITNNDASANQVVMSDSSTAGANSLLMTHGDGATLEFRGGTNGYGFYRNSQLKLSYDARSNHWNFSTDILASNVTIRGPDNYFTGLTTMGGQALLAVNAAGKLGKSAFGQTFKSAETNSALATNLVGTTHLSASAVLILNADVGHDWTITNRIAATTSVVVTNAWDGQTIAATLLGEASGGTARNVTVIPTLGHLIANLDDTNTAPATSYTFSLPAGNGVEISDEVRRLNGTNFHKVITRHFKF